MAGFTVFVGLLILATKTAGKNIDKVGGMLIKISIALMLMVGVCKLANQLTPEEMEKGHYLLVVSWYSSNSCRSDKDRCRQANR